MNWQQELAQAITDADILLARLQIKAVVGRDNFPLLVPASYVARMKTGDINDPLLKQVLPDAEERQLVSGFMLDPLDEKHANPIPGLLHKYYGRVLIMATNSCAANCRFCFRRHFPYQHNQPAWEQIFAYIQADPSISEVILSGGEPLLLDDAKIAHIIERLATIEHVTLLRIHTRIPIMIPARINTDLLTILTKTRLMPVVVIHCNHANEIASDVAVALNTLKNAGITLLNQSVLLKDVNDSVLVLQQLSMKLFKFGVLPYYLHMLDKVQGAHHFAVTISAAQQLMQLLKTKLPGYLVPRLVYEQGGAKAKIPVKLL